MMMTCSSLRSRSARVSPAQSLALTVALRGFPFVRFFWKCLVGIFITPLFRIYACYGGSPFACFVKSHALEVSQRMLNGPLHVPRGKQMDSAKESQVDQVLMILEPIFHSHDERDKQSWKPAVGRSKKLD